MGEAQGGEEGHKGNGVGRKAQDSEKCGVEEVGFSSGKSEMGKGKSGRQNDPVKSGFQQRRTALHGVAPFALK